MNNLKVGSVFKYQNEPATVLQHHHSHQGRGGATVRLKIKLMLSAKVLEVTLKPSDKLAEVDLSYQNAEYLYQDQTEAHLMNSETFEQLAIPLNNILTEKQYLKEGQPVTVIIYEQSPVGIQIPKKITLEVTETTPAVRGDTAQGSVSKEATLETGYQLKVPLFVKTGDLIVVNTESGQYVARQK